MPRHLSRLAAILSLSLAVGLPGGTALAQDNTTDRLLRGIVNGVLGEFVPESYGRDDRRAHRHHRHDQRDERRRAFRGIPPGHHPPPGTCRVWYPDRPAGHQPRPGRCDVRVPRGAFLVYG